MKQQTAVEWLESTVKKISVGRAAVDAYKQMILQLIQEAKAMEKEQHGNTWDAAIDAHERRGHNIARSWCDFDEHYNETYNK